MKRPYRRKKRFIRADLQLKIIFIALFVSFLVLLINLQMCLAALWVISLDPAVTIERTLDVFRSVLVKKFLIAAGLGIPIAISVGILYSFKFSGPIFRFKKYFEEITKGRWDRDCFLRKGDYLWDLCETINGAVRSFRDHVDESHQVLQETCGILDEVSYTLDENGKARVQKLKERIAREEEEWWKRFPPPETEESPPPTREVASTENVSNQ